MFRRLKERFKTLEQLAFENFENARKSIENAIREEASELNLSRMGLDTLPAEIGHLTNLTFLDVSLNQLTILPAEIGQLANLTTLDLSRNKLSALPPEIGHLTNLTFLDVSRNQLTILPSEIGKLTNLTTLDLSHNELRALAPEIGQLLDLVILDLTENKLTMLPSSIGQLKKLQSLGLDENWMGELHQEVGRLINLTKLSVGRNRISKLPTQIGQLESLIDLNLFSNRISEIPNELYNLRNLEILNLGGNEDHSEYWNWTHYIETKNLITNISPLIKKLVNLKSLNLQNNNIKELPSEFLQLINLESLDLRGNELSIPPEILNKRNEPHTIMNYFAWVLGGKRKPINEIKILMVGQGSVGKTSLVQRILHGTFDPNQDKTEGISINQWQVNGNRGTSDSRIPNNDSRVSNSESPIKLNIWDFGGQEIMHATHQFFLTKRSLYLLVLDARLTQEENRVEYWLKIIQSFGDESPVLIIGNKTDQHPLDVDRTGLRNKYPNIVGILETSAATGTGIEALKAEIAKQVDTLPHVRDLLPETWFTVKSKLEELGRDKNFITQDEYLSLCGANDVTDATSQHTLIGFLHDLGVVLYFQDDPRLEALGILNPQWVTNGVYKILNSHELFQNQGTLTLPMLNKILNLAEYPSNKRLFIVDMMKKFELCYDIEPDKSFLIPDLLPKDEIYTGEWKDALAFQIHYNVLPSSIISRFIVRMNTFIHKHTVWRSGVVLKRGNNTALVKADYEDRIIYIWVSGDESTRRELLTAIRMELDAIHKTIAKIEATEKVPVPNAPEATPVDLTFLQKMASEGRESLPVQAGNQIIDLIVKEVLSRIQTESGHKLDVGGNVDGSTVISGNNNVINIAPRAVRRSKKK